jgi:hypothetical protein
MKKAIILPFVFLCLNLFAQAPWRAKLYVHFSTVTGNNLVTDTVWFGCDSLGAEGYQTGLDQLDTALADNKVFFEDAIVKNQLGLNTPYNLNKSIKAFKRNGDVTFRIQAFGQVESISWDTADFIYNSTDFGLFTCGIRGLNCYLGLWDRTEYPLLSRNGQNRHFRATDSLQILQGFDMLIDFIIRFKDSTTGLIDRKEIANDVFIQNPIIDDKLEVSLFNNNYTHASVYNQLGQLVWQQTITQTQNTWDVSSLPNGIYLITFNNNTQQTKPIKLLKQ